MNFYYNLNKQSLWDKILRLNEQSLQDGGSTQHNFLFFLYIPRFNEIIVFSLYNSLTQFMNNLVLYLTPKVIEHAFLFIEE